MTPTNRWIACLGLCASLATAAPSWGLDLVQAYQLAREQDASLRAARAGRDAELEREPQARAQLRPRLSASANQSLNRLQRSVNGGPEVADRNQGYQQSLQLRQVVYNKGLTLGLAQAQQLAANAQASLDGEERQLALRLAQGYFEVLLAQDALRLVLKQQALYLAQADAARKALAAGAGTRTDIDETQARLDLSRADELAVRQQESDARQQLAVMLGRLPDTLAVLAPQALQQHTPDARALDEWLRLAQDNSPELRALQAEAEAARLGLERAQAGQLPTVDAVLQWTRSGGENLNSPDSRYVNRGISVQVNWPLYTSGLNDAQVRQASALWIQAQETLAHQRRELAAQVGRTHGGASVGWRKVQALQQAEASAEQLVASTRRSLQAGSRTVLDVLDVEQRLQDTRRQLSQARYDYLLSRLQLHLLAGQSIDAVIAEANRWLVPLNRD